MNDPRFSKLHTDPRFVRPKADKNKLVVDSRFKEFFDDSDPTASTSTSKSGKVKKAHKVDKYGRPLEAASTSNELKRYYRMPEPTATEDEEKSSKKDKKEKKNKAKAVVAEEIDLDEEEEEDEEAEDSEEESDEESDEDEASIEKPFIDRARGEGGEESSDEERRLEELSDSDSDSEGSVTLAPLHLRKRRVASLSRSPSIDLSETEPTFGLEEDEQEILSEEDEEDVEPTKRLAVVNMDWDHLRATDLYRVLASSLSATAIAPAPPSKQITKKFDSKGEEIGPYKPPSRLTLAQGRLFNLRIYPSKFGTERMEREMREGPPMEVFMAGISDDEDESRMVLGRKKKSKSSKKKKVDSDEDDDDEITARDVVREQIEEGGEDYDGEALRKYQLERLRYYYAVATFDSPAAAAHVFNEINGTEFERTANMFDLQYIPDETSFEEDPIHDEATEASVSAAGAAYQGIEFVTDALRHSKVKLTWDADDPHRKNKISSFLANANDSKGKGKSKGAKEMNEDDIKAYLASSSDENEDDLAIGDASSEEEDDFFESVKGEKKVKGPTSKRDKLRNLFGLDKAGGSKLKAWDGGKASKSSEEMQITFAPALTDAKSRLNGDNDDRDKDETAIETYKRKDKERRERKKAERKAKRNGITLAPEGEEGPEFGGQDDGPGGFDDAFFAEDADEAFAAFDAGEDLMSDEDGNRKKNKNESKPKLNKKQKRAAKEAEELKNAEAQASLSLLVASDSDDPDRAGKHFDMRAILKAEKNAGKKHGGKGKGKKGEKMVGDDTFEIDVKDDRFKSLHEDFDFAIDPTDTRFQKTKNTAILLAEGRKRREKNHDPRAPVGAPSSKPKVVREVDEGENLRKLVESVKRKSGEVGGRGKRAKVDN